MLSENVKKWVAALRSGKYKQAKHRLHFKDDGYCCLGVGCEVMLEAGFPLQVSVEQDKRRPTDTVVVYDNAATSLPYRVQEWLGMSSNLGRYAAYNGHQTALAFDNDSGKTFEEIADIIESEPKGLFLNPKSA